jgi:hypothetical protein
LCKSHFCEFQIVFEAPCLVCAIVYCCFGHFEKGESPGVERIFSPVISVIHGIRRVSVGVIEEVQEGRGGMHQWQFSAPL